MSPFVCDIHTFSSSCLRFLPFSLQLSTISTLVAPAVCRLHTCSRAAVLNVSFVVVGCVSVTATRGACCCSARQDWPCRTSSYSAATVWCSCVRTASLLSTAIVTLPTSSNSDVTSRHVTHPTPLPAQVVHNHCLYISKV